MPDPNGSREHNEECLDIWLTYYAGGYVAAPRVGETPLERKRKGESRMPVNLLWLQAITDVDIRESDAKLRRVVLREMPTECAEGYDILSYVYLFDPTDIGAPERWRRSKKQEEKDLYELHQEAIKHVLDEIGDFWLTMVEPEAARDFVEESKRKRRVARSVYGKQLERTGDAASARKQAAKASGLSLRQVQRLTRLPA